MDRKRLSLYKGPIGSRSNPQLYICVKMRHNTIVLLLFLVLFRLSSVKAYKVIDDNLQEEEDPEWNQVIGNFTNFWPRSYIFQVTSTFSKFYLNSSISFRFSFSISLFFLDFHFPFPFLLLFGLLHILTMAIAYTYRNDGSNVPTNPIMITNVSATPIFFQTIHLKIWSNMGLVSEVYGIQIHIWT